MLNTASWNQRDYLRSVAQDTEKAIKDTAPDEFFFNFIGYNGKFCLDHNGYWKVQCDKPVKVEFDGDFMDLAQKLGGTILAERADRCYTFKHFTLIVEDGTKYVFGGDMDAIELSIDFFGQNADSWIATSWYLTEIILPTGQRISLTYEREETEFINQMYTYAYQDLGTYLYSEGSGLGADVSCEHWTWGTAELKYGGKLLSPVYLTEITTSNIVISFYRSVSNELKYNQSIYDKYYEYYQKYDNSGEPFLPLLSLGNLSYPRCLDNLKWYKLDRITIERFLTESVDIHKNISLGYNNDPSQRLILERVAETGKKPYTFSYNQADKLPGYLSNQLDHWGFYNGKEAILNYATYHTYKTPDATCTLYGVLKRITYPTGGYTEFEFEPHDYRKQLRLNRWEGHETLSGNNLAGGARIKKITSAAGGDAPEMTKEYYYVSDYIEKRDNASKSSGVLGGQAQYYFTDYRTSAFNVGDNVHTEILMNAFSTISVLPASQNTSCHIGYTDVIEKLADNSFTRYQFSNFDNGYNDEPADAIIQLSRTPYESYASKSMDRGKLILQEHYNANGTRIWCKAITYEKDASTNNYVRAMNATNTVVCYNGQAAYDEGTSYKIYTYPLAELI